MITVIAIIKIVSKGQGFKGSREKLEKKPLNNQNHGI